MGEACKVLIVDDEMLIRQGIINYIAREASNDKEAMQLIAEFSLHIEFIVLSSFEDFDYVRAMFQNRDADYRLKLKLNGPELLRILQMQLDARLVL